jgi:hypothetical protein
MNSKNFYSFGSKLLSSTVQVKALNLNKSNSENSDLFDQHMLILGIYDNVNLPVIFNQQSGKKIEDIIDTGWAGLYLISDRLKQIMENERLSGWKTFPVRVYDKNGSEIEKYHGFSITGRCGPVDINKSNIVEKQIIPDGPFVKYYRGLYVGLDKWDGSDFFIPEKYYGTIMTERAAVVLKKNRVTNLRIKNLMDIDVHI